mmetsp:Transcript_123129/g.394292  ORF Transcript_123129/g.394292 Transcript_123129/m.394292 type:complete len:870 (-) Transcript_123129:141-2750(-)
MLWWCSHGELPRILGQRPGQKPPSLLPRPPYARLRSEVGDARDPLAPPDAPTAASARTGAVTFEWNGRDCQGGEIHQAALNGDHETVRHLLASSPSEATARFKYNTVFQDISQEGSGEPIHLAASRGHAEVVLLLHTHGAELDSCVTRGGKDHYDVLHSAVFAEGRLDNTEVVKYLLQHGVLVKPNSDGQSPLHVAFRTGSLQHIRLVRKAMHDQGVLQEVEGNYNGLQAAEGDASCGALKSPLLTGIELGRMTEKQLARAAAHTPSSLRTFIDHEPRCIPHFVQDILELQEVTASTMAAHLTGSDLAKVIEECPQAACALLDGVLEKPICEGMGWHSLPSRVSFAPRCLSERMRYLVNPERETWAFYEPDITWRYNVAKFEAPAWHAPLMATSGKPIRDCVIKVCHVPDILCAEFFSALGACSTEEHDDVFKNAVVNGSIEYTWWQGACRVDIMQVILSLWGLILLILESYLIHENMPLPSETVHARQLRPHAGGGGGGGDVEWGHGHQDFTPGALVEISVAADFIGAKGVVDFVHELLQLLGYLSLGQGWKYLNLGNAWDLFRAATLMTLFFDRTSQALRVMVIFICWMRLLDVFTSAEKIAVALLPIKRSAKGLLPVSIVTLVSFCAFMHAFQFVWGESKDYQKVIFKSFSTLITTELPAHPRLKSPLELVLTYGAVIFFSIFILNIFIGVIGQQYELEKERVQVTLKHERAQCCLNFLLRVRVLPCSLCGRTSAVVFTFLAAAVAIWLQLAGLDDELGWGIMAIVRTSRAPTMYEQCLVARCTFAVLQFTMILMQYQNPEASWAAGGKAAEGAAKREADLEGGCEPQAAGHRYLWLALPVPEEADGQRLVSRNSTRFITTFHENW